MSKKEDIQHDCEHCHSRYKSIFCQIAPDEVKIINENKWCQSLEKGQQLFAEGAYPHGLFCVNTGKIKIHQIKAEVIYNDEISSLNTLKSVIPFFIYHIQNFLKKSSD